MLRAGVKTSARSTINVEEYEKKRKPRGSTSRSAEEPQFMPELPIGWRSHGLLALVGVFDGVAPEFIEEFLKFVAEARYSTCPPEHRADADEPAGDD
jgi:hypothetical protein